MNGATSAVLGLKEDGRLIGTVMVGNDGHRGWVYYLAVSEVSGNRARAGYSWLQRKNGCAKRCGQSAVDGAKGEHAGAQILRNCRLRAK